MKIEPRHTSAADAPARPDARFAHDPFPFVDLQQAYWLGQTKLFQLGNIRAHVYAEFDKVDLDLGRLEHALRRLIERHEMLRVVVTADGRQQTLPEVPPFHAKVVDLRGMAPEAQEQAIVCLREKMLGEGPTTDAWPLFELVAHLLEGGHVRLHASISLLIFDNHSARVLAEELPRLYADPSCALEPLRSTFREYAWSLEDMKQTARYQRSRDYWWKRIPSLPPAPDLPLARSPETIEIPRFRQIRGSLTPETWSRLEARAARAKLTPSVAMCAAYSEVLAAWSGKSHLLVNVLLGKRLRLGPEMRRVVGNFSATSPLEVRTDWGTFAERAHQMQTQMLNDLRHDHVSGVEILREINRVHGGSSRPGMPVVFVSTLDTVTLWKEDLVAYGIQTAQVWLDHQVYRLPDGSISLHWDAIDELFPEGLLDDMFDAYLRLLNRLADEDEAWEERAPRLTPERQLEQRASVNATEAPCPPEMLHTLFAAQAARSPEQWAVITSSRRLTYAELDRRARQVGHRLRQLGARPNQLVAIVMEKGWEQVVAALGILYAGAAYLPIDPTVPAERLRYLLQHSEVEVALTQSRIDPRLSWPEGVERICVDSGDLEAIDPAPLAAAQGPEDLAYVIFTSGSTGLPKGVMIDHRGAVNTILDVNRRFQVGPEDRALALSALNFDLSVYDVFGLLAAGGAVVIPDDESKRNPARWAKLVAEEKVTLWNSVPALMEMMMDYAAGAGTDALASLRLVMMSGDWIPVKLPDRIRSAVRGVELISLGGATEASIWSILYPIGEVDPGWKSIPYGRPMDNQRFHVLDASLEPCPDWVPGELYIGGIGLAKGYWRDEERTSAHFIRHPRTGERLYRTGDHGRYLPDGNIEFLGRKDFQVKVQGYRIELGEIEATLERHPGVRAAVATVRAEAHGTKRLVGYVVPRQEPAPDPAELRRFLQQKLPEYMVPSVLMTLDALPLSDNGKVDRSRLPGPEQATPASRKARVPPADALEARLVEMWEDILNVSPIGVTDSFFADLGGQSLLAVRLIAQIQRRFCQEIALSTLLQGPTIRQLACALREGSEGGEQAQHASLVPVQPRGAKRPLFFAHPIGGNVLCYAGLAHLLGEDQPFHALQSAGLRGERAPRATLEEMAREYLVAVREVQPEGPYLLGGWSMGGVIALEMACQLRDAGEEVDLVAMLDSHLHRGAAFDDASMLAWFARDLKGSSPHGSAMQIDLEELRRRDLEGGLRYVLEQAREAGVVSSDVELAQMRRFLDVFEINGRALLGYAPRVFPGELTILRVSAVASAELDGGEAYDLGWSRFCTGLVHAHGVPGDHYTMLAQPAVQAVAEHLRSAIALAERKRATRRQRGRDAAPNAQRRISAPPTEP